MSNHDITMRRGKKLTEADITMLELPNEEGKRGGGVGMVDADNPDPQGVPLVTQAMARVNMKAGRMIRLIEEYFEESVFTYCEAHGLEGVIAERASDAIDKAIQKALESGWGSGKETHSLEGILTRKVKELASAKIEKGYSVEVDVRLVKKGGKS